MNHLESRKYELQKEIESIDSWSKLSRLFKRRLRKQKVATQNSLSSMLMKQEEAEKDFVLQEQSHLKDDPVYKKALAENNIELLDKFHSRKLTVDEYYDNLFDATETLSNWMCCVETWWKWGIINKDTWEFLMTPKYDKISEYDCWICCINNPNRWFRTESYLYDKDELKYLWEYEAWREDYGQQYVKLSWKWSLFDKKTWKILTENKYDEVVIVDKNFAEIEINWKWWLANNKWETIVPTKYDAICRDDDKDCAYIWIWDMSNTTRQWKKWWLINKKTWEVVIEPIYYRIWQFQDWIAEVENDWKKFYINKKWEIIEK